ncbi:MAG: carboxypeptidase-like regulatory domain-containing protein [Candidatus Korobacteraceae bacterium]|jgi:carboxypeptidase family protein
MTLLSRIAIAVVLNVVSLAAFAQQTPSSQANSSPSSTPSQQPATAQQANPANPGTQGPATFSGQAQPDQQAYGLISGTVTDKEGALAVGAKVALTGDGQTAAREVLSGDNGEFSFSNVPPGAFHLTVTAPGFNTQQYFGELEPGQAVLVPPIQLALTGAVTEVRVGGTSEEIAEVEVKQELQQRAFGILPNFFVTYSTDPAPLRAKQKLNLAWKSMQDPATILGVAFLAGIDQASDQFAGYGQGAAGYGRRFGAEYGDVFFGTFIGSAILPSILHQDPRYFYRGTGSIGSRLAHALENSVVARNDRTKKWGPNYSGIIGSFAAAGLSSLYYPANDRTTSVFLQNSLIRVGESSVAGIIQEFVLRKFTSHAPKQSAVPSQP